MYRAWGICFRCCWGAELRGRRPLLAIAFRDILIPLQAHSVRGWWRIWGPLGGRPAFFGIARRARCRKRYDACSQSIGLIAWIVLSMSTFGAAGRTPSAGSSWMRPSSHQDVRIWLFRRLPWPQRGCFVGCVTNANRQWQLQLYWYNSIVAVAGVACFRQGELCMRGVVLSWSEAGMGLRAHISIAEKVPPGRQCLERCLDAESERALVFWCMLPAAFRNSRAENRSFTMQQVWKHRARNPARW